MTIAKLLGKGSGSGRRFGWKERWRRVLETQRAEAACYEVTTRQI